jgi:heat-inducible transcriptional repressor
MLNRRQRLLKLIVEEFINKAEPVGSNTLIEKHDLPYSSATIRAEMAELEAEGYLEKTHTSSGRVPSTEGYRYYVKYLRDVNNVDDEVKDKIHQLFTQRDVAINEIIKHSCEIISQMSNLTTVMLGPDSKEERLSKVQLVSLNEQSAVAVFVTDRGHVEHKIFAIPNGISLSELESAVEIINKRITNTKLSEIIEKINAIKPLIAESIKQHELIFKAFLEAFLQFASDNVSVFGRGNLLDKPEFNTNINRLRKLVNMFENKTVWKQFGSEDAISIQIGNENSDVEFDDLSVVSANVSLSQNQKGKIALVGPIRMDYSKVVATLKYLQDELDRYFSEESEN